MFGGGLLAAFGAISGLAVVLELAVRRLRRSDRLSPAAFLAVRRLSWRGESVASAGVGVLIVGMGKLVAAGVDADLAAISPSGPHGDAYAVQQVTPARSPAALAIPVYARMLQVTRGPHTINIAECGSLERILEMTDPSYGPQFQRQCRPAGHFVISTHGKPDEHRIVLAGMSHSTLFGLPTIAANPTTYRCLRGRAPSSHFQDSRVTTWMTTSAASSESPHRRMSPT